MEVIDKANGFVFIDGTRTATSADAGEGQTVAGASSMEVWGSFQTTKLDCPITEHSADE